MRSFRGPPTPKSTWSNADETRFVVSVDRRPSSGYRVVYFSSRGWPRRPSGYHHCSGTAWYRWVRSDGTHKGAELDAPETNRGRDVGEQINGPEGREGGGEPSTGELMAGLRGDVARRQAGERLPRVAARGGMVGVEGNQEGEANR